MALTPPPSAPPAAPPLPGQAPSRANPSTFRELADAFVVWQVGFRDWLAGMVTWLAGYITWASTNVTEMGALQADVQSNADIAENGASSTATAAAEVEANRAALDNRLYPGTYAADPVTRPDGSAVQVGDRYFNSTIARQKTYSGTVWATDNLDSAALAASGGSGLVGFIDAGVGAIARTIQAFLRELPANPKNYGAAFDGITDDTAAIQRALNTGRRVKMPRGDVLISGVVTAVTDSQHISGAGMAAAYVAGSATTRIRANADTEYFRVSGKYVVIEGLLLDTPTVPHTKPHVRFVNGSDSGEVLRCRVNGADTDGGSQPGVTFDDGAGGLGTAIIGRVTDSYVVNATVNVRIHDVKITGGYVWALSKQWGIGVFNGVSNFVADGTDIVPPLAATVGLKAGVYVSGASANPSLVNCYVDGNFSLNTGKGVIFENGVIAPSVIGGKANGCDDDVITFDSCIAPVIKGMTFYNNNGQGNGASDIVLKASFAQLLEKPLVEGTSHIQTAAVGGGAVVGAAVKLAAGTTRRGVRIHNVSVHQPGAGGGYTDQEILLEDGAFATDGDGTLRGCRGTRRLYAQSANAAYAAADLTKVIAWPATMAYAPRIDQLRVNVSNAFGSGATPVRVQAAATGNTTIGFVNAWLENTGGSGTWHTGAPTAGTVYVAAEL